MMENVSCQNMRMFIAHMKRSIFKILTTLNGFVHINGSTTSYSNPLSGLLNLAIILVRFDVRAEFISQCLLCASMHGKTSKTTNICEYLHHL